MSSPLSSNLKSNARGCLFKPGIVLIPFVSTTKRFAPKETLISLISKTKSLGLPFNLGSPDKESGVLAIQIGISKCLYWFSFFFA